MLNSQRKIRDAIFEYRAVANVIECLHEFIEKKYSENLIVTRLANQMTLMGKRGADEIRLVLLKFYGGAGIDIYEALLDDDLNQARDLRKSFRIARKKQRKEKKEKRHATRRRKGS